MKRYVTKTRWTAFSALILAIVLACVMVASAVLAEGTASNIADPSPAIYVAQATANGVVGVITNTKGWNRQSRETSETMIAQGSGVVIGDGYIMTNAHVIESGTDYQVLLASGEKIDAQLVGADASTDIAVLKVESSALTPVKIGSSGDLVVGSTVIAIGNPGGEVLANTVTSGIVSALERDVNSTNVTRQVLYIQHDAAINSGNSGGGLFNINGELIGINTLKYAGSAYSSISFEGLGFAIPIDTAYPIAQQIIENGKVLRPGLGVTVATQEGPDEAMNAYPPASVCIYTINENSPAQKAGLQQYDFITEVDGTRVTSLRELTTELDKHQAGDTVTLTVVRYNNPRSPQTQSGNYGSDSYGNYGNNYNYGFGDFFGNWGGNYGNYGGNYGNYGGNNDGNIGASGFETLKIDVTLEIIE